MGVCWVGGCDMPGSECRGGRAFWVPLTAASGEALAPPPTELKNGFVWRLGSGVLCALGCAIADIRYDSSQTVEGRTDSLDPAFVAGVLQAQTRDGEARLRQGGTAIGHVAVSHSAEMSYTGQIHTLRVPVEAGWTPERMAEAFEDAYRREYGNTLGGIPTVIVSLKTSVRGVRPGQHRRTAGAVTPTRATPSGTRRVYFGGWMDTPIYDRATLRPGAMFDGPAIVEQADTTSVIEPGMAARVDPFGNILVEMA